jgi:hypothetical protein
MGPSYFKEDLPMQQNGPLKLLEGATDGIEWAHYILKRDCRCNRMGLLDIKEKILM